MCGVKVPKIMEVILLVGNKSQKKVKIGADLETRNPSSDVCVGKTKC